MIKVFRRGTGTATKRAPGAPYTGEIWQDLYSVDEEQFSAGANYFTPGARTHWHSHPGGQMLLIEHGEGLVGTEKSVVRVSAGDIVWTPPGVRHWHGATDMKSMQHTAVTLGGVDWEMVVSEEEYAAACEG